MNCNGDICNLMHWSLWGIFSDLAGGVELAGGGSPALASRAANHEDHCIGSTHASASWDSCLVDYANIKQ